MSDLSEILPVDKPLIETFKPDDWLKTIEVANLFGVNRKTVNSWVRRGRLDDVRKMFTPTFQPRFYRPDVEEMLKQNEHAKTLES